MNKIVNSKNLAFLIALFILVTHFLLRTYNYNNWSNMLGWDVMAYYLYLPFTFIYNDPGMTDQSVIQTIFDNYNPSGTFYQAFKLPNGNWSPMYTLGMALLYLPFFFVGHIWASLSDYPADGFSFPYQFSIANGVMIYIVAGVFILRKVLLHLFSEKITSLVMVFMLLGTSYFHETIADECGPHAIAFAGVCLILWLNIRWHEKPTLKSGFFLGLVLGLVILARGSGIVVVFIPLLWNIWDKESFQAKIKLIITHWKTVLVALVGFGIFPLVQVIFWKAITGSFIFNTYQVTPGFDWLEPHFMKVLFSYKKGWLIYTPMVVFSFIGLLLLKKMNKKIFWPIIIFFLINFYLVSCWGTWWQGGSFGSRYFVESYPILCIPLGYFIEKIWARKFLLWLFIPIASFFVFLNLFQTWQFNNWILDGYSMTKAYYWKTFLKTSVSEEDRKLREIIRDFKSEDFAFDENDYTKKTVGYLDFDNVNTISVMPEFLDTSVYVSAPNSCKITPEFIYGPTFKIPYNHITKNEHAWLRVSFKYMPVYDLKEAPASLVITMDHNNGQYNEKYRNFNLEKYDYKVNEWNTFSVDYLTPYPLSEKKDKFYIYVYLRGDKEIFIDDMQVVAFERKW